MSFFVLGKLVWLFKILPSGQYSSHIENLDIRLSDDKVIMLYLTLILISKGRERSE